MLLEACDIEESVILMPTSEQDLLVMLTRGGCKIRRDPSIPARPKIADAPPPSSGTIKTLASAMSEDELQTSVIEQAHLYGYQVAHFRSVKVTRKDGSTYWQTPVQADGKGFPDLVMARDDPAGGIGRLLIVELKKEKEKPDTDQKKWLSLLILTKRVEVYVFRPSDWLSGKIEGILR